VGVGIESVGCIDLQLLICLFESYAIKYCVVLWVNTVVQSGIIIGKEIDWVFFTMLAGEPDFLRRAGKSKQEAAFRGGVTALGLPPGGRQH
jgi:hypothetical protein